MDRRSVWWMFLALMAWPTFAQSGDAPNTPFTGDWTVKWCDADDPKRDCGGLSVALVQDGERVSGVASGATLGLSRLDECGPVTGIVEGDTAYLIVRSARKGEVFRVDARVAGDTLAWHVRDTLVEGDGDLDIVAANATLARESTGAATVIARCAEPR